MKVKIVFLMMILLSLPAYIYAQSDLRGTVINSTTKEPLRNVQVTLKGQNQTATTDARGNFVLQNVPVGKDVLLFNSPDINQKSEDVFIKSDEVNNIGNIGVVFNGTYAFDQAFDDEIDLDADEEGSQEISSTIILSNDVFLNKMDYNLSRLRFSARGYSNRDKETYINGVILNDQNRGVFSYSSIGALNDLTRNGDVVNFTDANNYTFGDIGGSTNINMRAGSYAKGSKVNLLYTNGAYKGRVMATYSTGLMDNGWAFTGGLGGRYADEGNIDGTYYRNFSYSLAVEKQFDHGRHSLSFNTFGSPVQRGLSTASVGEVYQLVDNNLYNSQWGYQDGSKRNARIRKEYDPTAILSHIWKINNKTKLTTGAAIHYLRYGQTALNWYNAPDPRPDYYRNLPSYYEKGTQAYDDYTALWRSNNKSFTQINWDDMFMANRLNAMNGQDGALYMVEERRSDLLETTLNSVLTTQKKDNSTLTVGIGLRHSRSKQYKTVDDLLGAKYVLDIDKYADRDYPDPADLEVKQNNLNNPNKKAVKGDVFGYDYRLNINSANVWLQNEYKTSLIDFYYASKLSYTDFYREGKMKNGRYPTSSYGKGSTHSFVDYALKGGFSYKITGRHYITGSLSYRTEAPLPNIAYISPRISDDAVKLESGRILTMDINYVFSLPTLSGRVGFYRTNFYDMMKRVSYYHDSQSTYVNHVITGMSMVNRGFEFAIDYKATNDLSLFLAGTASQFYYNNNPDGVMSTENAKTPDYPEEKVYMKDYYVGGTPQVAATVGATYFFNSWIFNVNMNTTARNYVDIAPNRRLASNYKDVIAGTPEAAAYKSLTHQERYGTAATFDLAASKRFNLPDKQSIRINMAINNIFNRENIKTGGFEQQRMNLAYPERFGSKYYYMQGINFSLTTNYIF